MAACVVDTVVIVAITVILIVGIVVVVVVIVVVVQVAWLILASHQYCAILCAHMQRKSNDFPCQEKLFSVKIEKFWFFIGYVGGGGGGSGSGGGGRGTAVTLVAVHFYQKSYKIGA